MARERSVTLPTKLLKHEAEHHDPNKEALFFNGKPRSLNECFEIFGYIPSCVNDAPALKRIIIREVLYDFANDNIAYLELRTGPKVLSNCSKKQYVEVILDAMSSFEQQEHARYNHESSRIDKNNYIRLPLIPRLIISVDRSGTVEAAEENINLATEMMRSGYSKYLVGVELGGNPTKNDFRIFEPVFKKARDRGLKVSIHCGEIATAENANDSFEPSLKSACEEALSIIDFRPDRLGHALLLPNSLMDMLILHPIPIECCPTSNVMTLELATHHGDSLLEGLKNHPQLDKWIKSSYPFSINTDDAGIFCTNLTKEYLLVAKVFELNENDLADILIRSIDHIFDESMKEALKSLIVDLIEVLKITL